MSIRTKRVYDTPAAADGNRVLIERLSPRSYLIGAKGFGIDTSLRSDYESAILRRLNVTPLEEAWDVATNIKSV